jgi:ribosomal protein L16 Arg81 hydroxylase
VAEKMIGSFADLIAPIPPQQFFAQHWETAPLHVRRNDKHFYDHLLTNGDVETLITSGGLRFPAIQLARDGAFFAAESFTRNIRSGEDVFAGVPDIARIKTAYRAGATISLPGVHRSWKPLAGLVLAVEEEFDHATHANIYITPASAKGFTPHYDTHEVFVLQIAGQKRWAVAQPPISLPHRTQPCPPAGCPLTPRVLEAELQPGDLLYLPRGFVHTTSTLETFSVHVTLGVTVYTWIEVLMEWLQAARLDERFRRALPPGFADSESTARLLKENFKELSASLQQNTNCDHLIDSFLAKVRSVRPAPSGEFRSDVVSSRTVT